MKTHLLVVDTETGGLDAEKHALLSVAVVDSVDGEAFHAVIRPDRNLITDAQALEVNGFTMEYLDGHGVPERDAMGDLCLWLGSRRDGVLAGCNVPFDAAFLRAAFLRHETPWPLSHRMLDLRGPAWAAWEVGALELSQTKLGQPRLDLDAIAKACGLGRTNETHDALEDALLTLGCFQALIGKIQKNGGGQE
jgi:DNA polymerase III epsilon subunit-like protein